MSYGTRSAPFLALRVIKQLVKDEGCKFPLATPILENDTYIDDIMGGAHDENSAKQTRNEIINLLQKGNLVPRIWASNSGEFLSDIDPKNHGLSWEAPLTENDEIRILVIKWSPVLDIFRFVISKPNLNKITKSSVLLVVAKLYDPVGWISPVIVRGKLFIQQLWKKDLQWDELLPAKDAEDWTSYIDELRFVSDVTIPRWIGLDPYALHSELHGFCDASERAYGSVIYLRVVDNSGRISVTLLTSITKVAPIKQLIIPRLELQAAVILARLITVCR